jgi:hypothetical protein
MPSSSATVPQAARRRAIRWLGAAVLAAAVVASARVDVPQRSHGLKGDEATYIAMALSLAHDHDLKFRRVDLERFERVYGSGPEGLFLKEGSRLSIGWRGGLPRIVRTSRDPARSLEFGKAFVYPLV